MATSLEDFVKYMGREEELAELSEQMKDSRANVRDNANKRLRECAYETLKDIGQTDINFEKESPETISGNLVKIGIDKRADMSRQDSARILVEKTDDVLNYISKESLEKIALSKPLAEKGAKGFEELMDLYKGYLGIKELVERYNEGKVRDKKELQILSSGGAQKAEEGMRKRLKGYSKDIQDVAGDIAALAAQDGLIKEEYIKEGTKGLIEDAENRLRDYEKEKNKKVADYAKESLKGLIKGDTKEFETARQLVYHAAKDTEKKD